jgi:hypothetical protein
MKKMFKTAALLTLLVTMFASCVGDPGLPKINTPFYKANFNPDEIQHNTVLDLAGWTNFSEFGTVKWYERIYQNDGYAQFNPYGSGNASSVGWLITPAVDLAAHKNAKLSFQSATNFVSSADNKLEVYVSSDYNGADVLGATWTKLSAKVADNTTNGYVFIPSGEIDLSAYNNQTIHIAFKVTGNSTTLAGLFQVDKINVYTSN